MGTRGIGLALALVTTVACQADDPPLPPDAGADHGCADGLVAVGRACAPVFDECADDEVPLLGGGCKRVGVRECPGGIAAPPDWTCKRVGVEECTPAGGGPGLRGPPSWTCKAIGPPTTCKPGWKKVARGWCEPVLPPAKCGEKTMEVLGEASCQPVGDCGSGTWGQIKPGAATLFVYGAYPGGGSDGSQGKPYTTIGAALQAAGAGARIAVAAGTYKEDVVVSVAGTELVGRCPKLVTIVGQSNKHALKVSGAKAIVRGVAVTGPYGGVHVSGTGVRLDEIVVAKPGKHGIAVVGGTATITSSLIASAAVNGVYLEKGAQATLKRCTIRDTRADLDPKLQFSGYAVRSIASTLTIEDSLISDSARGGASLDWSDATVERSVVRRTAGPASPPTLQYGAAINAFRPLDSTKPGKLVVSDSLLYDNVIGVLTDNTEAELEQTVIRDTRPQKDGRAAAVVGLYMGSAAPAPSLTVKRCLVTDTTPAAAGSAVDIQGGTVATFEGTVVQRTRATAGYPGCGIEASPQSAADNTYPKLTLRDCLVADNAYSGVRVLSSDATVDRTVVRGTRPDAVGGGRGIEAFVPYEFTRSARLTLRDSLVAGNQGTGVFIEGSKAEVVRTVVRDSLRSPGGRLHEGYGIVAGVYDRLKRPASLKVQDSLVINSYQAGIAVLTSDATIERTVVRDTRPAGVYGYGLILGNHKDAPFRASVATVKDSLFTGNHRAGIGAKGGRLTLERAVVRDTGPVATPCDGWGLVGQYANRGGRSAVLEVTDTVLANNPSGGFYLSGSEAELRRVVVRGDPGYRCAKFINDGAGVFATTYVTGTGDVVPAKLTLQRSRFDLGGRTGLQIVGASAAVDACEVRRTDGDDEGGFGDGVTVSDKGSLALTDSLVARSKRAGLLVQRGGSGSARRSIFARNTAPCYLQSGGSFTVGEDNVFIDNTENRILYGTKWTPSPLPKNVPSSFE